MNTTHKIKILPLYFAAVISGKKKFELRINDRDYALNDYVLLQEYKPYYCDSGEQSLAYTGQSCLVQITYIMYGGLFNLAPNSCIFSFEIEQINRHHQTILENLD